MPSPVPLRRSGRNARILAGLILSALLGMGAFLLLDRLHPLPMAAGTPSLLVTAGDGTPLRAFADADGVWRYPLTLRDVSPRYLEALLGYEDRWFYHHPGINPFALLRAAWQRLRWGRTVSGGSTLTMQVARLLDPHTRTVAGKLRQMFRTLQLEWHFSKAEILTLYINRAPFGGTLQGVGAASHAYLGKGPQRLSHAEAALLAVLPQAPSRLRPDRHPDRAQAARDKVLDRLQRLGDWSPAAVAEARQEQVARAVLEPPLSAALLARRLRRQVAREAEARGAQPAGVIRTTVAIGLQWPLEEGLAEAIRHYPAGTSAAVLVLDNQGRQVRAYAGSADFLDHDRFGHLDMVRAWRSPGSTLKPFLYGLALEEGLVHSESLLVDAPQSFGGYQPENFNSGYHGPVGLSEALIQSLNLPAVALLERLGPERFAARLRHGGLRLRLPDGARPNLAMVLGGTAATLESLTAAFSALARGGLSGPVRFRDTDPLLERRLLSEGAAWIIRRILADNPRPDAPTPDPGQPPERRVAWKSGTSYGHRDAWAIGVSDRLTVGVWVGRPDGTPLPGHYGAVSAAPLLFRVFDSLPRQSLWGAGRPTPPGVARQEICWPLGTAAKANAPDACQEKRLAWTLDGAVPPTLPDRDGEGWRENPLTYWANPDTELRVGPECAVPHRVRRQLVRWPLALEPWLDGERLARSRPPPWDPACPPSENRPSGAGLRLVGIRSGTVLRRAGEEGGMPTLSLSALGGREPLYWLVDGRMRRRGGPQELFRLHLDTPGRHVVTVMERSGRFDRAEIHVLP